MKPKNIEIKLENECDNALWIKTSNVKNKITYPGLAEYFEKIIKEI